MTDDTTNLLELAEAHLDGDPAAGAAIKAALVPDDAPDLAALMSGLRADRAARHAYYAALDLGPADAEATERLASAVRTAAARDRKVAIATGIAGAVAGGRGSAIQAERRSARRAAQHAAQVEAAAEMPTVAARPLQTKMRLADPAPVEAAEAYENALRIDRTDGGRSPAADAPADPRVPGSRQHGRPDLSEHPWSYRLRRARLTIAAAAASLAVGYYGGYLYHNGGPGLGDAVTVGDGVPLSTVSSPATGPNRPGNAAGAGAHVVTVLDADGEVVGTRRFATEAEARQFMDTLNARRGGQPVESYRTSDQF